MKFTCRGGKHPILPDNYETSLKHESSLLDRLRQVPEVLRECDAVIRDQIEKGIVEEVHDPTVGEVGKVHISHTMLSLEETKRRQN